MNSWLYLTAKGFAHSVEIDYDNAPVFVWHDAQSPTETSLSEAAAGLKQVQMFNWRQSAGVLLEQVRAFFSTSGS